MEKGSDLEGSAPVCGVQCGEKSSVLHAPMTEGTNPHLGSGRVWLVVCSWIVAATVGCDRAPPEPSPPHLGGSAAEEPAAEEPAAEEPALGEQDEPDEASQEPACVAPLAEPPPAPVRSVTDCPPDVEGRPVMPFGVVSMPEAPRAPELKVELALSAAHQQHGLMFRPELADTEGMLFSWSYEGPRSFWMKNTCLALDMLFLDKQGFIVGILEQVPPMNEQTRRVPCPAAHVLEVRAGWTRQYGVKPGQRVTLGPAAP